MKIAVLWWTSWFGKWLAKQFKEFSKKYNVDLDVWITGRNQTKWEQAAKELDVKFTTNNVDAVKEADITVVSVTIWNTKRVINEIWPYLKYWSILADVTSVKKMPYEEMNKFKERVLVVPTHPMFWPFVKDIVGQVIVLTPPEETKRDYRYLWFKAFLEQQGAKIFEISPEIHDKVMSIVQWLTHFSLFVVWETLKRILKERFGAEKDGKEIMSFIENFTSPVYKMLTSLVGRYMWQNPWLYAEIQVNNEENKFIQEIFIQVAKEFNRLLFKDNNLNDFVKILEDGKRFFWEYTQSGQKYTDKIIFLLAEQIRKINENIWNKIQIKNIYTGELVEGILKNFENWYIYLDEKKYDINEWILI